jgi:serine/threonine protein phosphatase 1
MLQVACVGDVHGQCDKLAAVIERLRPSERTIVLLGDYVNHGPDSRGVLDLLVREKEKLGQRLQLLEGNHDRAFLDFLDGGALAPFLAMGGAPTVLSYLGSPSGPVTDALRATVPPSHRSLLTHLRPSWRGDGVLAMHKWPKEPIDREELFVVLGHYQQQDGVPSVGECEAYIDTGCGREANGKLTCLLLPEREWFSC